jgi:DNA-binding MarR family transcriptional regulator
MPRINPAADDSRALVERDALLRARELVDRMRSLYRELESRTGASVVMHRALAVVATEPGIPASRLASALGLQRSTMSHVLKALALKKWIERRRSDEDQRSVRLHVTAAGRSVLQGTAGRVAGVLQRAVRQLDEQQLRQLDHSLEALLRNIGPSQPVDARGALYASRGHRPARRSLP